MNLFVFPALTNNVSNGYFVPKAQGLMFLHLFDSKWLNGTSLQNMAITATGVPGAPGTLLGAPTFPAGGGMMTNTAGVDGLATGYTDPGGDLTLIVIGQNNDTGVGNLLTAQFLGAYAPDTGGLVPGAKGVFISTSPNTTNIQPLSAISRAANVVAATTTAAHGFLAGQYVSVAGVTGDTTMNGFILLTAVPTTTTFTYVSAGANGSGVTTGATAQNGAAKLTGGDTILTGTGAQTITSISRSGNTVTLVTSTAIAGLAVGGPVYVQGVTGDTSYNGVWAALTVSGTTVTFTSAGTAGSGTVTGATAALGTDTHLLSPFAVQATLNQPHYMALTIQASTGIRTLYDLTSGTTTIVTTPGPRLLQAASVPVFTAGVSGMGFGGKIQLWWIEGHAALMSLSDIQQNYATAKNWCATRPNPIVI